MKRKDWKDVYKTYQRDLEINKWVANQKKTKPFVDTETANVMWGLDVTSAKENN